MGSLYGILEAFLTPRGVLKLEQLAGNTGIEDPNYALQNLWCLSPSIHKASRDGHIEICAKAENMAKWGFTPEECLSDEHKNSVSAEWDFVPGDETILTI